MKKRDLIGILLVATVGAPLFGDSSGSSKDDIDRLNADEPILATPELKEEMCLDDASLDVGWSTEVLNGSAGKTLKAIDAAIQQPDAAKALADYIAPDLTCDELRPATLNAKFSRDHLTVRNGACRDKAFSGAGGLADAFASLRKPFSGSQPQTKYKITKVRKLSDSDAVTELIYLSKGSGDDGTIQQNADWQVYWDVSKDIKHPLLKHIEVSRYEEIESPHKLLSECTESALSHNASMPHLRRGTEHWWGNIDRGLGFSMYGDYGIAMGDVDNDGLDDIYICQPGGIPNVLLRHRADGKADDISRMAGVDILNDTSDALMIDLDNDRNQDLIVGTLSHLAILRGDGTGRFEVANSVSCDNARSFSAADYDMDGDLDVFVCRYSAGGSRGGDAGPLYDSRMGRPNVLLRNDGAFQFTDVTNESGFDGNHRTSFASSWADYDMDGDPDLYIANDFGPNNLYRNDEGQFADVAFAANAQDQAAGMGVSWADYNNDGLIDLHVSNMFSGAGNRILPQPHFNPDAGEQAVPKLLHFARGNTLLKNKGNGTFEDVSVDAGITMGRWSWGAEFMDLNNDGWEDILVPNGFITNHLSRDL